MLGQTLNWGVKWSRNSTNLLFTESWWNKEYNETRIKWFGIIIKEKSLFGNQQKSITKIGQKYEFNYFYNLITYLILILIPWISWITSESYYYPDWRDDLASIHVDWRVFLSFIFDVRSEFKGRLRLFLAMNSWLSCFNGCGIGL